MAVEDVVVTSSIEPAATRDSTRDTTTRALLDCVADAIVVVGPELDVRYANRAAVALGSGSGSDSIGTFAPELIHPDDIELAVSAVGRAIDEQQTTVRLRLALPDGELPVEVTLTNHLDTGGVNGVVACFRNLEHEEALRKSLERQQQLDLNVQAALTDELTGLPNRRLFLERLERALGASSDPVAVFFVDLDDFKAINDALGHTAGDAMLRSTTNRLLNVSPQPDQWGRIGGDEFVLFLERCDREQAAATAQQLCDSLRQPIVLGGRPCYTSASVGVTVVDHTSNAGTSANGVSLSAGEAVRQADIAMYEGKRVKHGLVTPFRPEMEQRVVIRTELEGQLRRSLIGSGPSIVFQPIVDLRTGTATAVEALARWHSPTQGPIGPDRFVAMAEHLGIVDQLDRHVLRKACREMADVRDPATGRLLSVTVNISTIHLTTDDFARSVLQIAETANFDPARLVLEVTESIGVEWDDALGRELDTLRGEGVRIALDDFGTGHSSLAQLETLAVDYLKVDRSFLSGLFDRPRRLRYLETIVNMADALELGLVFEGIETSEQAKALVSLGVTHGQGYLMAAPIRADELTVRLEQANAVVGSLRTAV
jgi:diguanylate cyclase (GGDEF)-like protein